MLQSRRTSYAAVQIVYTLNFNLSTDHRSIAARRLRLSGPLYSNKLNQTAVAFGAKNGFAPGRAPNGFGFVAGDAQKVLHPAPI